jgi:cytochrome c oxidase subunit 2
MIGRRLSLLLLALALGGCSGIQSALGGDGRHGEIFGGLFAIFLAVTVFVYLLVIAFLLAAIFRRRGRRQDGLPDEEGESREAPLRKGLIGWAAFIALGLSGLTVASFVADRLMAQASGAEPLRIQIVAHQWWWEVRYQDRDPSRTFRTANELHLPVGVPAHITLMSNDVIHSFWVPNLAGKQDLVPGRTTAIELLPAREGVYRGQCAEYCGLQHAHMALDVTVEPVAAFRNWRTQQLMPAPLPRTPVQQAGLDYIETRECGACHSIVGTRASGQVAPDLTHLASRRTIGAGTYPMSRGHLYAWVADPQSAKPGNHMPHIPLEPDQLHAIVAYLETLR